MDLLITFAIGMTIGIALGVALTILVSWTRERIERQRTFDDFAAELRDATDSMRNLFTDEMGNRRQTFGTVSEQLNTAAKQTNALLQVTNALSHALSHPTIRGQWGERMVEDVLKPVGFQEGINYIKQTGMELTADRPDFTFLLPRGLKVNLDAKFPLDSYLAYYQAKTEEEKREYKKRFLGDVRRRVKGVVGKGYINPEENTVDFVLVFIPNEQVYSFINVYDPALYDDAIMNKVVLCSPWTLYPVLSIIRTAIDNFILEKTTASLLPLMGNFDKQWEAFNECLDKMGRKIAEAQKEHEQLVGTRHRQLDKVLSQIETLRQQTDFHAVEADGLAKQ
jgi:DNA recombination protein RmuC